MPDALPPFLLFFLGAALLPLLRGRARQAFALAVPFLAFLNLHLLVPGRHWQVDLLDFQLLLGRVDSWSLIFLHVFTILSFIGILYIVRENQALDLSAGLLYAGAAMGAVLAGDLITLFFFWELLTLGALLCLLSGRTPASGLVLHLAAGGSAAFDKIALTGPGPWLIFLGIGINCAWPLLGAWVTDTYPEASIGGTVFMATFTTKTAVYVLARTFPGEPALIGIGVAMAAIPIFYAVIENDLRRVLAYSLINQVGFMVVGVGLGTALSLNGTAAHVYCDTLFKALLFMTVGSVIYRTGKSKATELGGLCRSMPWTCLFCCIGAASISAFPLFSGFASKSIIMSAVATEGHAYVWLALLFASAGVFHHAGIKIPFCAFVSHDSGIRCKEAPMNQLLAMGLAAGLCLLIGIAPHATLYPMLPDPAATYEPYTLGHVTDQLALLLFSALAFTLLMMAGLYPAEIRSTNLDADWLYRKGGRAFHRLADRSLNGLNTLASRLFLGRVVKGVVHTLEAGLPRLACFVMTPLWALRGHDAARIEDERRDLFRRAKAGAFPVGVTAFCAVILLGFLAIIYYGVAG
jgi:multicomponent Na+:H+ antiporter subunit D